ncbi:putative oxidoreductase [Enhygromyxa salina]|uniref:Putative oxidoreductase n=1 Tax=Enhygromyxa salina TaxID=215803 RepID=A0A0C2DAH9_9BACT|nr:D-arabinono-1,4-lactone oxidase [Enhygromyxa salina]KIG16892.1 putative oxidoreductase [Enhygromyxa salina]
MKRDQLRQHPAYAALTPEEQAAIDERLEGWHLDALAVAAATGGVAELDPSDLRFWLASTARRPWAMISLCDQPEQANALFEGLLAAVPELAEHEQRPKLVALARDMSRALIVADNARREQGFVRDEQLAALCDQIDKLERADPRWNDASVVAILRVAKLEELANALVDHTRSTRGVQGFLSRVGERLSTKLFDLVHGGLYLATGNAEHEGHYEDGEWTNWTASYRARPAAYLCPSSEDELCSAISKASELRVVGGGHSFNDGPLCSAHMISLDAYGRILNLDPERKTARVQAGIRLRDLNKALWEASLGLPVLGSTDSQSIGGLVATDLHGTGRDAGFLSEQILSLRVIAADGVAQTVRPGDPLFHAAIGGIGTCGVVSEVELQLVDSFHVEKVTQMVDRAHAESSLDGLLRANDHISFYYIGGAREAEAVRVHQWNRSSAPLTPKWEKLETRNELSDFAVSAFVPGLARRIADIDEDAWLSDLVAPDHTVVMPGSRGFGRKLFYRHDEIEFGVPFERYQVCLNQILALLSAEDFFSIVECRFTPDRSQSLIGPGAGRRSAYIELATPLSRDHERVFAKAEEILREHDGQPHLGKKTNVSAQDMLEIHGDRFVRFQAVRAAQDPNGKFLNAFTQRVLGG